MADRRFRHVGARVHELVCKRSRGVDRIVGKVAGASALVGAQPVMVAAKPFPILADDSEPVNITVAWSHQSTNWMPSLNVPCVRRMNSASSSWTSSLYFLIARDGRFADADRADRFALDELDIVKALEQLAEQRRGHPTRGSSANDQDFAHGLAD